jgi:hypothetical protein
LTLSILLSTFLNLTTQIAKSFRKTSSFDPFSPHPGHFRSGTFKRGVRFLSQDVSGSILAEAPGFAGAAIPSNAGELAGTKHPE